MKGHLLNKTSISNCIYIQLTPKKEKEQDTKKEEKRTALSVRVRPNINSVPWKNKKYNKQTNKQTLV